MPTNKRHIKVPQDRKLSPTHVDKKNEQSFKVCHTTGPQ